MAAGLTMPRKNLFVGVNEAIDEGVCFEGLHAGIDQGHDVFLVRGGEADRSRFG